MFFESDCEGCTGVVLCNSKESKTGINSHSPTEVYAWASCMLLEGGMESEGVRSCVKCGRKRSREISAKFQRQHSGETARFQAWPQSCSSGSGFFILSKAFPSFCYEDVRRNCLISKGRAWKLASNKFFFCYVYWFITTYWSFEVSFDVMYVASCFCFGVIRETILNFLLVMCCVFCSPLSNRKLIVKWSL